MVIRLVISLTADQYAKGAAMLLDVSNPACSLQGSSFLKLPGWAHMSNSWHQKELGTVMMCIALGTSWTNTNPAHAYRINIKHVIDHVMFPWEGKPEFPDAVCYITGIFEQQRQGQTSMLILLDLSAAAVPIGHGCFWYVCSCLCEGPELHDWLVFFLLSERTQMAVLGDCPHALRGVSLLVSPNSSLLSLLLFSHRKQFQGLHNPLQKG